MSRKLWCLWRIAKVLCVVIVMTAFLSECTFTAKVANNADCIRKCPMELCAVKEAVPSFGKFTDTYTCIQSSPRNVCMQLPTCLTMAFG